MQTKTIHKGKRGTRVTPEKYEVMRAAILKKLPQKGGLTWDELVDAVAPLMPKELFAHLGSVRWYSKTVQLDLEARGLIKRVPKGKPMRLLRVK